MAEVEIRNISKVFGTNDVVRDVSLKVKDGEFVSLVGPSGCGKSTILRMIAGLEDIDGGELHIGGTFYNDLPAKKRGVAMVFQSYALFPHMTVKQNLAFGLKVRKASRFDTMDKINWAIETTGLEGLEERYPKELSGGQRQRVALGRALVLDPKVLLLDEPLSNLDAALRDRMTAELKRLHRQIGKTIIYVTHNQLEAMTLSDRIAVMRKGKIIQCDTPIGLYSKPACEFVAKFIGTPEINFFTAKAVKENGTMKLLLHDNMVSVDQNILESLASYQDQTVRIGIRPQHIYHHLDKVGKRHSDTRINVSVDIVEALGDHNLVVAKFASDSLSFLVDPDIQLEENQELPVVIDGRKIHFFHPETQERLF